MIDSNNHTLHSLQSVLQSPYKRRAFHLAFASRQRWFNTRDDCNMSKIKIKRYLAQSLSSFFKIWSLVILIIILALFVLQAWQPLEWESKSAAHRKPQYTPQFSANENPQSFLLSINRIYFYHHPCKLGLFLRRCCCHHKHGLRTVLWSQNTSECHNYWINYKWSHLLPLHTLLTDSMVYGYYHWDSMVYKAELQNTLKIKVI